MSERFKVHRIDPADSNSMRALFASILPAQDLWTNPARHVPLTRTIEYITKLGARCVLLQENVQDPDFLAEHSAYYSRWSASVSRFCTRLHFFSAEPPSVYDALAVIDYMAEHNSAYLGFVTLRPVRVSPQAATILKADTRDGRYVLAKDKFDVNLAGRTFVVHGTPFMQQDNAVGACAQASIWMALRTLRRKAGQAAFSPAQITSAATRFLVNGRTLPNRAGLVMEQIVEAVRSAGYAPHVIPLRDMNRSPEEEMEPQQIKERLAETKQALYPYIESGVPVLLILVPRPPKSPGGHAVLLIGHGWNRSQPVISATSNTPTAMPIQFQDASSWAEPFIIHNDNSGPYLTLPDRSEIDYALWDAVAAIPFLQPDVFIDGSEARLTALRCLQVMLPLSSHCREPLVVRTYLQEKASFRKSVIESNMADDVKAYYRNKWLPKRLWIIELSLMAGYEGAPNETAERVAEVLLDPTSEPEDGSFLSIHVSPRLLGDNSNVQGVMVDRNALSGEIKAFPVRWNPCSPTLHLR